jgi:hypothetical protein
LAGMAAIAMPIVAGLVVLAARGAPAAMSLVPLAGGLVGLGLAWRALGTPRAAKFARFDDLPKPAGPRPVTSTTFAQPGSRKSTWLYTAFSLIGCGSQAVNVVMRSDQPLVRAALLVWFVVMTHGVATAHRPHWRELLRPGGPRRDRCGRLVFGRMLRSYAIVGLPILLLASGIALAGGMGPARLLAVDASLACNLAIGSALGAWMAGAPSLAMRSRGPTRLYLAVFFLAVLILLLGCWHQPELVDRELFKAARYDALLLLALPPLLLAADRAWSRRPLVDTPRPTR